MKNNLQPMGNFFFFFQLLKKMSENPNIIYYGAVKEGKSRNIAKIAKAVL